MLHAFIQFLIQIVGSLQLLLIVDSDIPGMSENKRSHSIFSESSQPCVRLCSQLSLNGHLYKTDTWCWSRPSLSHITITKLSITRADNGHFGMVNRYL